MAYPDTHFSLCMFQIPEKYHGDLKTVRPTSLAVSSSSLRGDQPLETDGNGEVQVLLEGI